MFFMEFHSNKFGKGHELVSKAANFYLFFCFMSHFSLLIINFSSPEKFSFEHWWGLAAQPIRERVDSAGAF